MCSADHAYNDESFVLRIPGVVVSSRRVRHRLRRLQPVLAQFDLKLEPYEHGVDLVNHVTEFFIEAGGSVTIGLLRDTLRSSGARLPRGSSLTCEQSKGEVVVYRW